MQAALQGDVEHSCDVRLVLPDQPLLGVLGEGAQSGLFELLVVTPPTVSEGEFRIKYEIRHDPLRIILHYFHTMTVGRSALLVTEDGKARTEKAGRKKKANKAAEA